MRLQRPLVAAARASWPVVMVTPHKRSFRSVEQMSRLQAEGVMSSIIGETVKRCAQRGQLVSETLAAFMVSKAAGAARFGPLTDPGRLELSL